MAKKDLEKKPVTRSVILQPDVDDRLTALAAKDDRSISWLIAKAVKEMLDREEKKS